MGNKEKQEAKKPVKEIDSESIVDRKNKECILEQNLYNGANHEGNSYR